MRLPHLRSLLGGLLVAASLSGPAGAQADADLSPAIARKLQITPKKQQDAVLSHAATWLTGGAAENDYVSVGRLANYFGFVRFRIASGQAITRGGVGQETYALLDEAQRDRLLRLLDEQWPALEACTAARLRINRTIEGLLVGQPCAQSEVEALGAEFGQREAELGQAIATGLAAIVRSTTAVQRQALADLRQRGLAGELRGFRLDGDSKRAIRRRLGELDGRRGQELWNLAANLCTWATGTPDDNDYDSVGKPSQHFGFVDLRLESGHGVTRGGVADAMRQLLTDAQLAPLRQVVDDCRADFDGYFTARAAVNRALEAGLAGAAIDAARVAAAGRAQGLAEARVTFHHAMAFLGLRDALSAPQAEKLAQLRAHFVLPSENEPTGDSALPPAERERMAGQRLFALCALCHAPDGGRGIGPSLRGIHDRPVASVPGFDYSPALRARGAAGETWTRARLDAFLVDPQRHTPGTRMPFSGLPDPDQRRLLLDWLDGQSAAGTAPASRPSAPPATVGETHPAARPGFVVVVIEGTGAGWASTSVAMDDRLPDAKAFAAQTPSLARLAAAGTRFATFYASCPRCTPSRASLLTGMSAAKLGMTYVGEGGGERRGGRRGAATDEDLGARRLVPPASLAELPDDVTTVAELLHDAGYATAHFGKWHVGRQPPTRHGFDQDDGANSNQGPRRGENPNPEQAAVITLRGLEFVRAQVAAGKPFYLQLSHYGGGTEDESRAETRQALAAELRGMRGKAAWQAAILRDVDDQLGRVLTGLDDMGLRESTYVFVTFDHGAAGRDANAPLAGGKGSVFEGGIRVPFLVRGPGVAADVCVHVRASTADLLPTVAELAGVRALPEAVEGGSLVAVLRGGVGAVKRPRDELVVHFPHYDLGNGGPASAIFVGDHKLVRRYEDGARLLFDVEHDPAERHDLAANEPQRVAAMERRLDDYLRTIGAAMPRPAAAQPK